MLSGSLRRWPVEGEVCMRSSPPSALLISPTQQDFEFLHQIFREKGWTLYAAASLASGSTWLAQVAVVITEADLPAGTWRDVLGVIGRFPNPPLLIVVSVHADEYLWVEALNLGAYDVLAKPLYKEEVGRVLTSALMRMDGPRSRSTGA